MDRVNAQVCVSFIFLEWVVITGVGVIERLMIERQALADIYIACSHALNTITICVCAVHMQ